jgi:lipopolysaccharide export system protein LptA
MPLPVYHLRRLLAAIAVLLILTVAGMYFYARSRARNAIKSIPGKLDYAISKTATGFQISKSDGKRTLFTVEASDVKEFKLNGNAELHHVRITLYGRDSSRYDKIYGDDFAYNQKTGDVTAKGEVQIELVANPAGLASPDQSLPQDLRNPIHLKTRDLVFNKDSGNAWTDARVEWSTPQASGWAVGVKYAGKSNALTLSSQIHIDFSGSTSGVIEASHGVVTNDPREIVLEDPRLTRETGSVRADQATFYLSSENHVERVLATGNVTTETRSMNTRSNKGQSSELRGRADRAEFLLPGEDDLLHTAILSGNVHFEEAGAQNMQGEAGRVVFDFAGQNQLQQVHALESAQISQKLTQQPRGSGKDGGQQDFELNAPAIDFVVADGRVLKQAATSGNARITITQDQQGSGSVASPPQQTVVSAGRFLADFVESEGKSHLATIHGAPEARITNSVPGEPDRVSTSDVVDASFFPQGGIESVTQKGSVFYSDNQPAEKCLQAWAQSGRYTPADHMLVLTGSPRVSNGGMATTASIIRINRATKDAIADGDVKSTYSELGEQPDGALLAASSPIHVTARSMTAHNSPSQAIYTGNARLWQDSNVIEAPTIQFDRDHRSVVAEGTSTQSARTVLTQLDKSPKSTPDSRQVGRKASPLGRSSPISIIAKKVRYVDAERKVHYEGGVLAQAVDFTASAKSADAFLKARSETSNQQSLSGPGQIDHMVAQGDVVIREPNRQAQGETLTYTPAEDKFVLTGGSPSIFDAEQGKITGVSLTFFRRDDRVLVEGGASTPVVTTTRVAH